MERLLTGGSFYDSGLKKNFHPLLLMVLKTQMKRKCLESRRKTENERPRVHKQSSGGRIQCQMFAREMSTFKLKHLKQLR